METQETLGLNIVTNGVNFILVSDAKTVQIPAVDLQPDNVSDSQDAW